MILRVTVSGHLTIAKMEELFAPVSRVLDETGQPHPLIMDVLDMSDYDVAAREWFIKKWSPQYRPRVSKMALITKKTSWRMLTAAVALTTGQRLKAFPSVADAQRWLAERA